MKSVSKTKLGQGLPYCFPDLRKGLGTHSTIDNDGRQDTIIGSGTTHDTNKILFQMPTEEELLLPTIGEHELTDQGYSTTPESISKYHLGKRIGPPLFTLHVDDENESELLPCVKRDIASSAADSLLKESESNLDPLGSWTAFNKKMSKSSPIKCIQEYLQVSPRPPEYPICKTYLDGILITMKELELSQARI